MVKKIEIFFTNLEFWLDNFTEILAHTFVKINTKSPSFSSNLWTAFGLKLLKWPGIGTNFQILT
jgi:hypothetical protein